MAQLIGAGEDGEIANRSDGDLADKRFEVHQLDACDLRPLRWWHPGR